MDRIIVYPGQIPLDTDILKSNKNTLIGLSKLAHAMMGDGPWMRGLGCVPTGPASLQVVVNPGQIYSLQNLDGTAYGSLVADTTHQILKQGLLLDAVTLSCPAPGTAGQSINYLIEVGYLDTDGGSTVLPYYNSSNPALAYNGPNNTGTSQNTVRQGQCSVQVKAGTSAATGTQTTPAPDAGYIGAWVVTVANGQTTITAANISAYSGAPFLAPMAANGSAYISAGAVTLTAGNSGLHVFLSGTTSSVNLPTPVGNDRARFKFTGVDSNTQTINTPAGVIYLPDGTSGVSVTVTNQDTIDLVSDGSNFRVVAMSGKTVVKTAAAGNQVVTRDGGDARWITQTFGDGRYSQKGANDSFATGTKMPFYQAAAPTGWTQDTNAALNDTILRVVNGVGAGGGGAVGLSTFSAQSVSGHQLTVAEMPSHTHTMQDYASNAGGGAGPHFPVITGANFSTSSTGGDGTHSHGVGFQPAYRDVILCSKN